MLLLLKSATFEIAGTAPLIKIPSSSKLSLRFPFSWDSVFPFQAIQKAQKEEIRNFLRISTVC